MQEGRIVRGPNGERGVIRNGRIEPLQATPQGAGVPQLVVPPRPKEPPAGYQSAPGGLAPIPGGPADKPESRFRTLSPDEVSQRGLNPGTAYQINVATGEINSLGELPAAKPDTSVVQNKLKRVLDELKAIEDDATDNSGWFETGTSGALLRLAPGTAAHSLGGKLKGVKGPIATDAIGALADAGIKLGPPLSDPDVRLAESTVANLDPNLDHAEFLHQLKRAREVYEGLYKRVGGDLNAVSGFTDEQRQRILEYLPRAKSPEDLVDFARSISRREDGATIIGNPDEVLNYVRGGGDPSNLKFDDPYRVQSTSQLPGGGEEIEFLGFED